MPVHPALAAILAEWRLTGWPLLFGRFPRPDDLIVPTLKGRNRNCNYELKQFHKVLDDLGLRRRRQHDARRTFIGLCLDDGARRDRLELITHGRRGDIIGVYDEAQWVALCQEVAKLTISLKKAEVITLPVAAQAHGTVPSFGTALGTVQKMSNGPGMLLAERAGFEPAVPFGTHDFQSCTFGLSVTSPCVPPSRPRSWRRARDSNPRYRRRYT